MIGNITSDYMEIDIDAIQPISSGGSGAAEPVAVVGFSSVAEMVARLETLSTTSVSGDAEELAQDDPAPAQRLLKAARCLAGPSSREQAESVRLMCSSFQVQRQTKTEKGWRYRPTEDLKRDLEASVLQEAWNLVQSAALEGAADGPAEGGFRVCQPEPIEWSTVDDSRSIGPDAGTIW